MKAVVDRETFDKITCNRCGVCCEGMYMPSPLDYLELYGKGRRGIYDDGLADMMFYGQLEMYQDADGCWRARCGHFERDPAGNGVCTIYDQRPAMCSDFPYGRPVEEWPECAWYVTLIEVG